MAWCQNYPQYSSHFQNPCYNLYGGCYWGCPYRTHFQTVPVSQTNISNCRYPSYHLSEAATALTEHVCCQTESCKESLKNSAELSCEAGEFGERFAKFTQEFSKFAGDAEKFMDNMPVPDIENTICPQPVFNEACCWKNINADFDKQIGHQCFLSTPCRGSGGPKPVYYKY